jgi:hypothetical protein
MVATEAVFRCPITAETEFEEKLFSVIKDELFFTGRLDLQVEMNFANWILDFKSTSQNLSMQGARLNRSGQLIGYAYAGKHALAFPAEGCLVALAHVSAYKSKKTGEYGDVKTDFGRIPQIYNEKDLIEWRKSFIYTAVEIARCKDEGVWPVNFDSCYQYGQCTYTKLCDQGGSIEDVNTDGYHASHWNVLSEE